MKKLKNIPCFFVFLYSAFLVACSTPTVSSDDSDEIEWISSDSEKTTSSSSVARKSIYEAVEESGLYTTKDSVAAYLCKFDKLPSNYVGKNVGISLYELETGNTFSKWNFNPWTAFDFMVGGDVYENSDGLLPKGSYHEADVDYYDSSRGTKRLVYASDCVIYYTADHYKSFKKLDVR